VTATLLGLLNGDVVTNIVVFVDSAASGAVPTRIELGLYDLTDALLGTTGNVAANAGWTTGSHYLVLALTAPVTITSDNGYYCSILHNGSFAGSDPKILKAGAGLNGLGKSVGAAHRYCWTQAAQTVLPATATEADANDLTWFGVS
jgi:hypothetical protein